MSLSNLHFIKRINILSKRYPKQNILKIKKQNIWTDINWEDFSTKINNVSYALLKEDIKVQDKVGIFANNMLNWLICDFAILQNRAISVPLYATSSIAQAEYIINDSEMKLLFVGDQKQLDITLEAIKNCPHLQKIVLMKPNLNYAKQEYIVEFEDFIHQELSEYHNELQDRLTHIDLDDLFTLIYTSGTTGEPKGVMLDYRNLAYQFKSHNEVILPVNHKDISLSFLPLSHIFERAWTMYALQRGVTICCLENTKEIREALVTIKPTLMCAVPRVYEKIQAAVLDKVEKSSKLQQKLFYWATNVARKSLTKPNLLLKLQHKLADKLVLSKIRNIMGGRIRAVPCGGARLAPETAEFFHSIGVNLIQGYGMTETTATIACWEQTGFDLHSVGKPMPYLEVKIGEDDEILIKGGTVMRGYYNKAKETAEAFTKDGFFKTGDIGRIHTNGVLYITDRLKDLMKTSNGKYIAPQFVESTFSRDKFIAQIAVIADSKKFVSALIVPSFETLEELAKELNIRYNNKMELIKNSEIIKFFEQRIESLQTELASFERVKKFTLLPKEFSMTLGEITPTLKLRRKTILEHYSQQIAMMYSG